MGDPSEPAVVNTAVAFTLWNFSLRHLTAGESSVVNNAILPQIGLLGWVFLGEAPGPWQWAGISWCRPACSSASTADRTHMRLEVRELPQAVGLLACYPGHELEVLIDVEDGADQEFQPNG